MPTRGRRPAAALLCALLVLCAGCGRRPQESQADLLAVATTYPVYALAQAVTAGAQGVTVERLATGQVSCLHDYTLTVSDARRLEKADLLLLNGGGLEDFLDSALSGLHAPIINASAGMLLLEAGEGHHHGEDHDGDDDFDPHCWMDPRLTAQMARNIAAGFAEADPDQASIYAGNAETVSDALLSAYDRWAGELEGLACPYLVTFHDGFRYFARAFGMDLLFAMEEEDGATASARDIRVATLYIKEYGLPAVFMEANGSGSAARAVAGETGSEVRALSMLMDGPPPPEGGDALALLDAMYLAPMEGNIRTLLEVLS